MSDHAAPNGGPGTPDAPGAAEGHHAPDGSPDDDTLVTLETHGFDLTPLTEEQRQVLRDLSTEELDLILDIKTRLDEAGPEVQAHSEIAGGALF